MDAATFRPSDFTWHVSTTSAGAFSSQFGILGDIPVAGDYDGDGKTDIAIWRPQNGTWCIQGTSRGYWSVQWGLYGDIPVAGDYDGNGRVDPAVFRPSNSTWFVAPNSASPYSFAFGVSGDMPLASAYFTYVFSTLPNVYLLNLTRPDIGPNFATGDLYRAVITGPPNQPVTMLQYVNGSSAQQSFGNTDCYGLRIVDYVEQASNVGSYTQIWSVGNVQATPAISFLVGQTGGGGTISTTDVGQTSDGHVIGVSALSTGNGAVTTYSATELDYTASLYYDASTVGTLYQEGVPISSGSASNQGAAAGYLSAPAAAWKTYDLQTDHYVVAYIPYGAYFQNPFYYQGGSCGDVTSDCTFGPGGGVYYVAAASIYLGSTLADQTYVPHDLNNAPLPEDSFYDSFLAKVGQPRPSGATIQVNKWNKAIHDVMQALFIA